VKLIKLIANLGYGSRKEITQAFRNGWVTDAHGVEIGSDAEIDPAHIRIDGEPLDPLPGIVLMLHKPTGYTCSTKDVGALIYALLPERFRLRQPVLASIGRLDRETSGLLLMTDDGGLQHRLSSPKRGLAKVYEVTLDRDLDPSAIATFAAGTLMLDGETTPLKPADLKILEPRRARLTLREGRYHQVRRMFAAIGNHVVALHRSHVGPQTLGALNSGEWRLLSVDEIGALDRRADP
jgi:16S rRNA pseudouridine516 synthase